MAPDCVYARRGRRAWLLAALLWLPLAVTLTAGSISSVAPAGASAGIVIAVTGTGFDPIAGNNDVAFIAADGSSISAPGLAIALVNSATGTRRLSVRVPDGLPVGLAALRVTNKISGEVSEGRSLQIIELSLPDVVSAPRGGTGIAVRVRGSSNTNFSPANIRVSFGAGITIQQTTVESPTSLVATIAVASTAALGSRTVAVISTETGQIAGAFSVVDATQPSNRAPTASAGGPYSGTAGQLVTFNGASAADPDGDAVTSQWNYGDGATGTAPSHVYAAAGSYTATLTVSDGRGGTASSQAAVNIEPAAPVNQPPVSRPGESYSGVTGQPVSFDGSASSDPDAGDAIENYTWQFGDGAAGAGATTSHTYDSPGTFTASLTVRDESGAEHTATVSVVITRANVNPVADSGGPYSGTVGESIAFDATGSDDGDDDPLTYEWSFGDGEVGNGPTVQHTYQTAGTFVGALTVSDGQGGSHTETFEVTVTAASFGRGVITGRVFDDVSGLPVKDAVAQLLNADGSPAPLLGVASDALGRYRLSTTPGPARVRVTKDGWTVADLHVNVADAKRTDPDDARLTALDATMSVVSAVAGGAVESDAGTRLVVPSGALAQDQAIRVTDVSPQGLVRRLPLGWTPVAAADISGGLEFGTLASLTAPVPLMPPPDRDVIAARWDDSTGTWISIGPASRTTDNSALEAQLPRSGQYVLAVADLAPDNPPSPSLGAALTGVSPRPPPDAQLVLSPSPRVLFARPGARSEVTATAIPAQPVPSGTPLSIDLAETFSYVSGSTLKPMPGRRRFAMYRGTGGAPNAVAATFTVGPSRPLAPFELREGAIDLAGRLPADSAAPRGVVIGAAGGAFTSAAGARVTVPAGAAAEDIPVDLAEIPADASPFELPSGMVLLRALTLDLHGTPLTLPVVLSTPASGGLPAGATIAVVQLVDVGDGTHMTLAAVATESSGALVTTTDPLGTGVITLAGIRGEGRYAFIQLDGSFGYISGIVTGASGEAVPGAVVDTAGLPIAALTDGTGRYALLAAPGETAVRVRNSLNGDVASVNVSVNSGAATDGAVALGPSPPAVISVTPGNGAANVGLGSSITVTFSEAIDPASIVAAAALSASGSGVAGSVSLAPGNRVLTFLPAALLSSDTQYQFSLAATIRDLAGHAMAAPVTVSFETADVTPPERPQPGAIAASIPGAAGTTTVTGSVGTVDPDGVVIVRNLRTNALTTLTPDTDGSFSGIVAALRSDFLELTLCDGATGVAPTDPPTLCGSLGKGNATTLPVPPFRGADGSVVVGLAGGRVEGAGGVFVELPPNAVPDGTVVRVEPVIETVFGVAAPVGFPFVGGVRLDLGGVVPLQSLDLGINAPMTATPQDQIVVAQTLETRRGIEWTVVDRAHFSEGRYQTASPPFPGVLAPGSYAFLQSTAGCVSWVGITWQPEVSLLLVPVGLPFVYTVRTAMMPAVCNSVLDAQLVNLDTNQIIDSITVTAPPTADEIAMSPDVLSADDTPPVVASSALPSGQQVDHLELQFSEPMDPASIEDAVIVRDSDGNEIEGTVQLVDGGTRIVFRPIVPFKFGVQYSLVLAGATDLAGNHLEAEAVAFTPFDPQSIARFTDVPEIQTLLEKCPSQGSCNPGALDVAVIGTTLFLANGTRNAEERYANPANPARLIAVDVGNPFEARVIGTNATATNPRALAAINDAHLLVAGSPFSGDLLLVAGGGRVEGGELAGKLEIYDVTACTTRPLPENGNCLDNSLQPLVGVKFLSTPAGVTPRPGVPPESGVPLQITALHSRGLAGAPDSALVAYISTAPIGIAAVVVPEAFNFPTTPTSDVAPDALARGEFLDVGVLKNRVVGVEMLPSTGAFQLRVLSAELQAVSEIPLNGPASRLELVQNFVVDVDRDGRLGTAEDDDDDELAALEELFDLAFVTSGPLSEGPGCAVSVPCGELTVIDLSSLTDLDHDGVPHVLARVPLNGAPFSVEVDVAGRLAYLEVRGRGLAIVDISFLESAIQNGSPALALLDADGDDHDDRILSVVPKADIFLSELKIDASLGLAYTSGPTTGVQILQVADVSTELALDFRAAASTGGGKTLLDEKRALARIVERATLRLRAEIPALADDGAFYVLEQGSGSCFWASPNDEDLEANCAQTGFELGKSDHDLEVFVPGITVENAQAILTDELEKLFKEDDPGVADLNMFAMAKEGFEASQLTIGPPVAASGTDPTGDLAMGRQQLMLLWILTGQYVTVPGVLDGGPSLSTLLQNLATNPIAPGSTTGIPPFEGHERAQLERFNFYKTGSLVRFKGACEAQDREVLVGGTGEARIAAGNPDQNFNELLNQSCQDEIHVVAKAAIRSALGRLVANPATNALLLQMTREEYRGPQGCLTGVPDPSQPPVAVTLENYRPKRCGGFEEYIASTVVRSVLEEGLTVFQPQEIPLVVRFACLKVGGHQCRGVDEEGHEEPIGDPILTTDVDANQFLAEAIGFIDLAASATLDSYTPLQDVVELGDVPGGLPFLSLIQKACAAIGISITLETPRGLLRDCNLKYVQKKIGTEANPGAQHKVKKNMRVRALNLGARTMRNLKVTLLEGDGVNPESYEVEAAYPASGPPADPPFHLAGLQTRVLDVKADPEDDEKTKPVFPITFDLTTLQPGTIRALTFHLTPADPEIQLVEKDPLDNHAGVFYYVLEPTSPGVPETDPEPVAPDPDAEPHPLAASRSRLELTVLIQGAGAPPGGSKQATGAVYQTTLLTYRVKNVGDKPLSNVQVVRQGQVVLQAGTLTPGQSQTQTESFVPTQARLHNIIGVGTAQDPDGNMVGPVIDSALLDVSGDFQAFDIALFDASPLADTSHPWTRAALHIDDEGQTVPVIGTVTDGDQLGGDGRLRVRIRRLTPGIAAQVSITDADLVGVVDGIGRLEFENGTTNVADPTVLQFTPQAEEVTFYYRPPPVFAREAHVEADAGWPATVFKKERQVRLTVVQTNPQIGAGGSAQRLIRLRRPPVFLIHGLLSKRETWNAFQPLVPESGVGPLFTPVDGFDGRFDVFAVGTPFSSGTFAEEATAIRLQIGSSLKNYLRGYAIGKVDVVGHSMGAILTRRLANEFSGATADLSKVPFRKLIAIDSPLLGSRLASKIGEINEQYFIDVELTNPKDLLDVADILSSTNENDDDPPTVTPELKAEISLEVCTFMIQAAGVTPRFFTGDAVSDLEVGSPELLQLEAAGIRVPSHHLVGTTFVPNLGVSYDIKGLWALLGQFCNLTPHADTIEATELVKIGVEAITTFVPILKAAKTAKAVGKLKLPAQKISQKTKDTLDRINKVVQAQKFATEESTSDPTPIFTFPNDRIVETGSQRGGLPVTSQAVTDVDGRTDHTTVLKTGGIIAPVCLTGPAFAPDVPIGDQNGDQAPDASCRVIRLLEATPFSPLFVRTQP